MDTGGGLWDFSIGEFWYRRWVLEPIPHFVLSLFLAEWDHYVIVVSPGEAGLGRDTVTAGRKKGLLEVSAGRLLERRLRPMRLTARGVFPAHASSLHQLSISSALDPTRCKAQRVPHHSRLQAVSTVAWSADSEVLLARVQGGKRQEGHHGGGRCGGRWGPPGEEDCRLLEEYSGGFTVSQVLFAACELGVFDLLAEAPETLGSAAVAAHLGVSSRGTKLLLDACVSLKLLQVEVRREKAVYENTELASTYLARASPKSQQDMLLYTAGTTYLGWGHLAAAVRDRKNQYLKAFGVPFFLTSLHVFGAAHRSEGKRLQAMRGLQDERRLGGLRVVAAFDLSPFPLICDLGGEWMDLESVIQSEVSQKEKD
ncbi:acetylserotonin O-methyltransferase, partial [Mesoplodon densirostris]|uniref:acetylserotonin O-methyltransferase n=1 Tax=Mesoplodon densirostris TaxID=48708 RepID=UPI0028DBF871